MRYPVSGANATAILAATASSNQQIYGITSGKVFWLRGVLVGVNATTGPLNIKDATVAGTATTPLVTVDLVVSASVGPRATLLTFSPPGVKFSTNVCGMMNGSGSIPIGQCTVWGYEE